MITFVHSNYGVTDYRLFVLSWTKGNHEPLTRKNLSTLP